MTWGSREALLKEARSHLGYREGPNNENPFAPIAGHTNNLAWCQSFCAATGKKARVDMPGMGTASCQKAVDEYRVAGQIVEDPQPGDQMFLWFANLNRYAHTGWVEALHPDGRIICIEGNTDVKGGRTGGRVMRKVRSRKGMIFGRPDYVKPVVPPKKTPMDRLLKVGMRGQDVLNVQRVLAKLGNKLLLDGEFGPGTEKLVKKFQSNRGIQASGTVDAATWKALRVVAHGGGS